MRRPDTFSDTPWLRIQRLLREIAGGSAWEPTPWRAVQRAARPFRARGYPFTPGAVCRGYICVLIVMSGLVTSRCRQAPALS